MNKALLGKGMRWSDKTPGKALETIINEAAAAYRSKYGTTPNAVLVNAQQLEAAEEIKLEDISVAALGSILPGSIYIGRVP